ncbi:MULTISPECIES: HD domain-containing protein [Campylobacter]|uniref:HD family hydrolase, possible ComGF family competence protein n=2 Tax=Campylobacter TaxID=194 RepID=A7GVR6_CAMC5|nr:MULTISPECIES: HD domain-containing protein [Campylobacter]EAU00823.1 HD family hydrolase, possible ComGF family competence protein [Campylobacter curvus 525.92]MBN7287964.1 HD domain-containing protein [Campylobacter curvus]MDU6827539.1 HD domain-containing protein [Campylobacter sp.]
MISPELIEHIFKAASISRWNDYPKMTNLVELDKQAHKFIIAYFIAKLERDIDMNYMIEAGIFEFLSRVVVTDIRPDVFHHIQKSKKEQVNAWVLSNLENLTKDIEDGEFLSRLKIFLTKSDKKHEKERLILKAASYLATRWEFSIVYQTSQFLSDIDELKRKVEEEMEDYFELIGVRKIAMNQKLARLVDLSGRLRFQKRWAQTPRIPETAVLGHMLVVAILSYFYSLEVKACKKRLENNFFCALFHDLPESLTRDIISPVKYGVKGLNEIISEYEMRLIDEQILPFVPENFRDEFSYILGIRQQDGKFIKDEFENRIYERKILHHEGTMENVNEDKFNPIDGKALKYCDKLAAYIEAGISISYGVKSKELTDGFNNMHKNFSQKPKIDGVDFLKICDEFNEHFGLEKPPLR